MPVWVWILVGLVALIGAGVLIEWRERKVAPWPRVDGVKPGDVVLFREGHVQPTVRAVPADYPLWNWPEKKRPMGSAWQITLPDGTKQVMRSEDTR